MSEKKPQRLIDSRTQSALGASRWLLLFLGIALLILFSGLGSAALFEPDEGRNAEKAREILLLRDWITPHQNFLPTLDKPMFFYWMIAASFKLLGLSEWSARLPSALAALGCLFLVYRFARRQWGVWEALWSCLVLVTSLQFVIFARLVIFDMTLTFFVAWALFSFYQITERPEKRSLGIDTFNLYLPMALGTLIKGPVALAVPAMVILAFLLLTRQWALLKRINLPLGLLLYLVVVIPWYAAAEMRNPGYLRYFLWDEHFIRYFTPRFGRSKSWYYFFVVIGVGFLPWTLIAPSAVKRSWQERLEPTNLFLALWVVLPFAFFSASSSKLPHYVLPIYPPLALLVGRLVGAQSRERTREHWLVFLAPWFFVIGFMIYLAAGVIFPQILAEQIRPAVAATAAAIVSVTLLLLLILSVALFGQLKGKWRERGFTYLCSAIGLALFAVLLMQVVASASFSRASKSLAHAAAPFFSGQEQLVFYDTYLEGVPFYLRLARPAWLVQARERTSLMASNYLAARRPSPKAGYGPVVLAFDEFAGRWKNSKLSLLVIVKEKNLARLSSEIGATPIELTRFGEYLVITNR